MNPHLANTARVVGCAMIVLGAVTLWRLEDQPVSSNSASRFASALCFVERGTWAIDGSPLEWTHDKVFHDGHFYSSKPPAFEWLVAGVYAPLRAIGLTYGAHPVAVYRIAIFFLSFLPFMGVVWMTWRMCAQEPFGWAAPMAVGFGSLLWPFATTLSNQPLTAFLVLAALWRSRVSSSSARGLIAFGILAGSAVLFEPSVGLIWPIALGVLLLVRASRPPQCNGPMMRWRGRLLWFGVGVVATWALAAAVNYQRHGSALPSYLHSEWYQYPGSLFAAVEPGPKPYYTRLSRLYHVTFGHYGVFLMTPLLLVALAGAAARLRRGDPEPGAVIGCAAALLLGIVFNPNPRGADLGGGSYGLRWFAEMAAPLMLYLPAALSLPQVAGWKTPARVAGRVAAWLAAGVSVAVAAVGAFVTPWPHNAMTPYPFLDNLCFVIVNNSAPPHPFVEGLIDRTTINPGLSYHDLGTIYLRRGFFDAAAEALERAIHYDPKRIESHYFLAQAQEQTGKLDAAQKRLDKLLEMEPDHAGALSLLGVILIRQGQSAQALGIYDRLLARDPDNVSALNNSAMVLDATGQTTAALQHYDRSLAARADNFEALYNKASLLARLGQREAAAVLARRAIEQRPDHAGCQQLLRRLSP